MRIFLSLLFSCFLINSGFAQTVINKGDFAIVAVNANLPAPNSSRDDISFVCFKDITPGTELQILDAGYENCKAGLWSGGQEGGAKLVRTGATIPAGTVITVRTSPIVFLTPDNAWTVSDLFVSATPSYSLLAANVNMNQAGDQIYFAQGGTWTEKTATDGLCTINGNRTSPNASFPGNGGQLLFGFTTSSSWVPFGQSSGESGLFPGMECFSMAPTSGTAYNKYTGPLTPATQTDWLTRISTQSNWTSYSSSANFSAASPNYSALTISILPGGDIPTATWNTPAPMCSTAPPIDLSTYITGTPGGTFSGTGVTGNTFDPAGLNGNYDIVYTVIYKTCPIKKTNTITVNGTPSQPILNITAPTCTIPTGTISVTGSIAGLTFSSDGVTYTNTTGVFSGIAPLASYSITAKSAAGCISTAATGTMFAALSAPAQPTLNITAPSCSTPTGTITVTSTLTGLTFSNDGTTYTNTTGVFSGIAPNAAYSITAKNAAGCVSTAATGTMAAAPLTPTQPTVNVTAPTCSTPTGTVTVTSTTTGLTFSSDGTNYTNTTGIFSGVASGASYSITAKNAAGCISTAATGTMPAAPSAPATPLLNITGPTCSTPTGTITVTNTASGLTYSSDGTTYTNTTGVFSGIAAGAAYSITAKDAAGCISSAATGNMSLPPGAPATPTINVTAPTCSTPTGSINVTSATAGLTFSNDGVTYTNTTGIFSGIAAGSAYSITAKNASGCVSAAATGTMPAAPGAPTQPTLNITAPTCTTTTGTITVTSTLTGLTFSNDGITYTNTTGVFSNITAGSNYSITAKNAAGCTSTAATGTMPAAPTTPLQPSLSTTPPDCTTPTGTITVTSTLTGLTFSSDGTTYTNTTGVFSNIAGGSSYSITAKNTAGCISSPATGTMAATPATPSQPTIAITDPTCAILTGKITVTSTLTGLTFSNDGTTYTNTTGVFSGIAGGSAYSITAKNAAGCISAAATGTMTAAPPAPTQPTVITTAPTCTDPKGSITVTSSITGLTFSIDAVNYTNTTGVFTNLAGGVAYSINAKNAAGCISPAATVTLAKAPPVPVQPTENITDPTCTTPTGTITVTSSLTGLTFSNDGTTYTNTTGIFSGIAGGSNYSITAKNTAGCISTPATGTIASTPSIPAQPIVAITPPTCTTTTGSITVTSTLTGLTFSNDGTTYTNTTGIFSGIAGGSAYSITAKNATGCISIAATGTMAATPNIPLLPVLNVVGPGCTTTSGSITVTGTLIGLTFSNDGVNYTNTTGAFSNIAANAPYSITAKNTAGCISPAATGTMPAIPSTPAQPTISVTDPTCTVPTATLTVTSTLTGLTFNGNGTFNNTNGIFIGIAPGSTYSITAKNGSGCISVPATGTVGILPTLPAPALSVINDCGKSTITATGVTGTLMWSDGMSGNPRVVNTILGPITATQVNGACTSVASNAITTAPAQGLTPNLGKDIFLCPGEKIVLNPGAFDNYVWQDNSVGKTFNVTQSGTYSVTVKNNSSSCVGKDEVNVTYFVVCNDIYFPTAFSPNGDGLNDRFGPVGNLNQITAYQLSIYNRYGERVFYSTNPFEKWDGTHSGAIAATGNYVWHSNFLFNGKAREHKGNLVIVK